VLIEIKEKEKNINCQEPADVVRIEGRPRRKGREGPTLADLQKCEKRKTTTRLPLYIYMHKKPSSSSNNIHAAPI
jgi:hypothetical protein